MSTIYPVPAGRSSNILVHQRLISQLQSQQQRLLRVEQQMSTGQRIQTPSDDPASASRAMSLQRLLELKDQLKTNLNTSRSYLNATDTALSGVAELLANVRGLAVRAADSTTSELERKAMALEVEATIREMIDVGNETFRGRYLFAGSDPSIRPFESVDAFIAYLGNNSTLRSYADSGLLFDTSVPGQELFGAVSAEVRGGDWNPVLTNNTRLVDLRGGLGISSGSFLISDGSSTSNIDISSAETIGDVIRLINANPPAGREVRASITATGLQIEIDSAGGGSLIVVDEQGGTTASELGIVRTSGSAVNPIQGADLNPVLRLTTRLDDIMGVRAQALVRSAGANNDIILEARNRGTNGNGYTLQFVDDNLLQAAPGLTAGNEVAEFSSSAVAARAALPLSGLDNDLILTATAAGTQSNNVRIDLDASQNLGNAATVSFDAANKILTIQIDDTDETTVGSLVAAINGSGLFTATGDTSLGEALNPAAIVQSADAGTRGNTGNSGGEANTVFVRIDAGNSTANQVIAAIGSNSTVDALFQARLDEYDATTLALSGAGAVDVNATAITGGGSGTDWDRNSGVQVVNGGATYTIDLQQAETVEDLLNAFNNSDAMLLAEINEGQNGINIRSRLSGTDFSIGENGGTTATDLGIRSVTRDTLLSDLNHAQGVNVTNGTDFIIRRNDGVELEVDVSSARTVGDVLDLINNHLLNLDPTTAVTAQLRTTGNGIELIDDNPQGAEVLTVTRGVGSFAAWDLGLVPRGQDAGTPADGPPPTAATAQLKFPPPNNVNNQIALTAAAVGSAWNGVGVQFVNSAASGDQALVSYDPAAKILTIDVDPSATTANTVVAAITADGNFSAAVDTTSDPTNDGTGLVVQTGTIAVTSGGSDSPSALPAEATVQFVPPNDVNTALRFIANSTGTGFNGVDIEFRNTLVGDAATATYDAVGNRLIIDMADGQTRANTVIAAVFTEGTFRAELDLTNDPTNNGTGTLVAPPGVAATTAGGSPEVLAGSDPNPIETEGVFNSLLRLRDALEAFDVEELSRVVSLLDADYDRLNFGRAALGAQGQGLDALESRHDNEEIELRSTLSDEIDVDLAKAVSDFAAQQASYEASLKTMSNLFRLSLLDFL